MIPCHLYYFFARMTSLFFGQAALFLKKESDASAGKPAKTPLPFLWEV
jgi:hypothetical protein